jgi:hypothetical protein
MTEVYVLVQRTVFDRDIVGVYSTPELAMMQCPNRVRWDAHEGGIYTGHTEGAPLTDYWIHKIMLDAKLQGRAHD